MAGTAALTAPSSDANGSGWLRLNGVALNAVGTARYSAGSLPQSQTLTIQFDYVSWGGTGADGLTLFLYDTTKAVTGGATAVADRWCSSLVEAAH